MLSLLALLPVWTVWTGGSSWHRTGGGRGLISPWPLPRGHISESHTAANVGAPGAIGQGVQSMRSGCTEIKVQDASDGAASSSVEVLRGRA